MEEKQILWLLKLLPAVGALLVVLLFYTLRSAYRPERLILKTYLELNGLLREREKRSVWYQRTEKWLLKNGAPFHCGKNIDPARFLAMKLITALYGMVAFGRVNVWCGLAAMAGLFYLPTTLLCFFNRCDNVRMLPELKRVCHVLEIQVQAGVSVMDALSECYGSVQERRLRKALFDISGEIVMKTDIYEALNRFQGSFDNHYIDSLYITILQALESGQVHTLPGDISELLKDMEETVLEREKRAVNRSITFYQLGILTVVMGVVLYACVKYLL